MAVLIVFLVLILICLLVMLYFFRITFVKMNIGNFDDVNDPCNSVLGEFKEAVGKGIEHINSTPCKWVETYSFDKLCLKARYFDNGKTNTVILFHGYRSSSSRDFSCALKLYTDLGFNVLLVDQRAHGRSEGRLITFGVKESRDVVSWIDFVNKKYSPEKILIGGMSMGATTVLLAAGMKLPENVKAVVADCGYTSPVEIIKTVAKNFLKIKADIFIPFLNAFCRIFGSFSIKGVSTLKSLEKCELPIIFIHGKADTFVPCEMSQEAFAVCNEKSRIVTVEKAYHGMSFLVDENEITNQLRDFLTNCGY